MRRGSSGTKGEEEKKVAAIYRDRREGAAYPFEPAEKRVIIKGWRAMFGGRNCVSAMRSIPGGGGGSREIGNARGYRAAAGGGGSSGGSRMGQ